MSELLTGFTLGNAAILTNVCLLPLYPGLIAFLAGNTSATERSRTGAVTLGAMVLAGVLSMMILIGLLLTVLNQSFNNVLPVLLPVIYLFVLVMGAFMLSGRNPFARLSTLEAPVLSNPYATAYVYGLLLGPMTLPCTGPIITSAFALGANNFASLVDGLLYFVAFGLGFGWPLVVLPLFAVPIQRRLTRVLTQNHTLLTRVSGVLLVGIALLGFYTEVLTNVT